MYSNRIGPLDGTFNLPSPLHNKNVVSAIPSYIDNTPPIVSYTYTNTIARKIFNFKRVVSDIDFLVGTRDSHVNVPTLPICMGLQVML